MYFAKGGDCRRTSCIDLISLVGERIVRKVVFVDRRTVISGEHTPTARGGGGSGWRLLDQLARRNDAIGEGREVLDRLVG